LQRGALHGRSEHLTAAAPAPAPAPASAEEQKAASAEAEAASADLAKEVAEIKAQPEKRSPPRDPLPRPLGGLAALNSPR
jgi:hypothetical protein